MRIVIAFSLGVAAFAAAATAQTEKPSAISLSLLRWDAKLRKADVFISDAVGGGPVLGQEVDYLKDFGVDDGPTPFYGVRGSIAYGGRVKLRGGYQQLRYHGNAPARTQTAQAGYTIPAGSFVNTSMRYDFFEVGLQWDVINTQMLNVGVMFEPKIVNLRIRTAGIGQEGNTGPAVPFWEKEEEVVPIPAVGIAVNFRPIENFGIRAEAKGLRMPLLTDLLDNVEKVQTFDWEVEATIYLGVAAGLTFGYRSVQFEIELKRKGVRNFETDMKARGWFAALDLQF